MHIIKVGDVYAVIDTQNIVATVHTNRVKAIEQALYKHIIYR